MTILQGVIFIEVDINTRDITFLRTDTVNDYDKNTTNIYVQAVYKNSEGDKIYLSTQDIQNYMFTLYTLKPGTNNPFTINGVVTTELKEQARGGVVKFVIPKSCTNRAGVVKCELHVTKEAERIASTRFIFNVEKSLVTTFNEQLLDDEDFPVLQQLILEIQKDSNIDDNNISKITSYSSNKVETIKENLSSQININKTNIENIRVRKFNPKFDRIIYFSMSTDLFGNYTSKTKSQLLDEIKKIYNLGCDGVYLIVHLSINKNTNSLYITGGNYSEIIRYIIDECKSIGLEIRAIKVHCEQADDQLKLETINNTIGLDNFKTQYKTIITELINIVGKDIDNFIVFNELPYMYANSSNENYSIEIVNYIQSRGYSVSISTADIEGLYLMGDNLKNNLDYFCLNFYPIISHNGFDTNLSDSINMVMDTGILNLIRYIKQYGKSFYISETGCADIEEAMSQPWYWTFNDMTTHNGYAQQRYLEVIFNLFNDLVDGVCYWWDLDSNLSSYIKKSTKGGDIIE